MKKRLALNKVNGFTLIEIIISIAIILLFSGLVIPRYLNLSQETELRQQSKRLAGVFELAKKKATAAELYNVACTDFNGYRVVITADSFSLDFGCDGAFETVQEYALENNNVVVTGIGNFDFPPGGFGTNISQNTISLKNNSLNKCVNISITSIGIVTVSDTLVGC